VKYLKCNRWAAAIEEKKKEQFPPVASVSTNTRVVRKRRFPMIFHNEKHVYWH
jgi:hypothetical protein